MKLFEILSHLSPKEIAELGEFIKLPSVNKGRSVVDFYKAVIKFYPEFNHPKLIREKIYNELYPGKKYKDHIMRIFFSALYKMTEEYLAFKNLIRKNFTVNRYLIRELTERKAFELNASVIRKQDKILSSERHEIENYYDEKRQLQLLRIMNNIRSENVDEISDSIKKNIELTTYDFFQSLSVMMINIMNYRDNYNLDFSGNLLEILLEHFDTEGFMKKLGSYNFCYENPEIAKIYLSLILTANKKEDEDYYCIFRNLLLKNLNNFTKVEKYNLMVALGTCTSMKSITVDREKYLKELFEIYRIRYVTKLYSYHEEQPMNLVFFYSTLRLAIALNELDWAENFVNEASALLPPEDKDNMKNFALSEIYFTQKQFLQALEYLSKIEIKNIAFSYEIRSLQLQIYYELEEIEAAEYALDAYRHFLSKNKSVSEYFRISSNEFISIFSRLLRLRYNPSNNTIYDLQKDINKCRLPQKKWFSEKFNEILSKVKIS